MSYHITVNNGRSANIVSTTITNFTTDVVISNPGIGVPVAGNGSGITHISAAVDIDNTSRQDGYFLVWNESLARHQYISAFEILDRSDGTDDDALDYGTY